jgi:hypothetical protein
MRSARFGLFVAVAAFGALGAFTACSSSSPDPVAEGDESLGEVQVALTNAPSDVSCLRLTVVGSRTDVRTFDLEEGDKVSFKLKGLPVGNASIAADAFGVACSELASGVLPTWYSEAEVIRIFSNKVTHVSLAMIHNGQVSVGVDFDEDNGPDQEEPVLEGGVFSSQKPMVLPAAPGVLVKAILTVGDAVGKKPDGVTPYRLVGLPDGTGAFDNGDGTFTWLVNHEAGATAGIPRAHGGRGAFVSKWVVRKADLAVLSGADLGNQVVLWNTTASSYDAPTTGTAFARFCSADLPAPEALYDAESGLGFDGYLFFNGEENGNEGRAVVHGLDGTMWEAPRLGKLSWENSVPNPGTGTTTVVAGLDDTGGGQVYFYFGSKTASGSAIDKAGLTNGKLYGLRVVGQPVEGASGIPNGPFDLYDFGNVENTTGATLDSLSNANLVTKLNRPEDGAWDPNKPNDFYFVTTNAFASPSRLWRVSFKDATRPELGGTFEMLLDGTEGQRMFDNLTIDRLGHVYLQEDPGGNVHLATIWRYDIATDTLVAIAKADPTLFDPTSATFVTNDEEVSGIVDASDLIGPGWFLFNLQVHKSAGDAELIEGGQLLAIYDPEAAL